MVSTLGRKLVAVCACAALMVAGGASTASAAYVFYSWDTVNPLTPGGPWVVGPLNYITGNAGWVGGWACVNALNYYGGTLAGAGTCGNWGDVTVGHPYDGTTLRDGVITPYGTGSGTAYGGYETVAG